MLRKRLEHLADTQVPHVHVRIPLRGDVKYLYFLSVLVYSYDTNA
jgi:hypothetical protein